ncbi:phosphoglycerate kinase [Candidatus Dependentiae bacterium]|nr:phosphoglycerate kinase [Candidatus Dependentiae bacterium]
MLFIKSKLRKLHLKDKRVFLRVDLNIDLNDIDNSFRLKAILPTIDYLLEQNACIILATHIGRPKGYESTLSTEPIAKWFIKKQYKATHISELDKSLIDIAYKPKSIIILENLRFYKGEQDLSIEFAKLLKSFAQIYVNDAFGVLHRNETSITLLPKFFDEEHKTIGLLVEKELEELNKLILLPGKFCLMLGGAKIKDKLILLKNLIEKIDTLIILPAIVFTFWKALGKNIGKSLFEIELLAQAKEIIELFKIHNKKIIIPDNFLTINDNRLEYLNIDNFKNDTYGLAIGPESLRLIKEEIMNADKIFYNGAMGLNEFPESLQALKQIFEYMTNSQAFTVVAGGDSTQRLQDFHLEDKISFCSSGGGSTLKYLSEGKLLSLNSFLD